MRIMVRSTMIVLAMAAMLFAGATTAFAAGGREATGTAAAAGATTNLRIYVGDFAPRERTASDRWDPPSYLNVLIERYTTDHPNVSIEILPQIADGSAFETWASTQYLAGRGPDIGNQLFSEVNRNAERGWYLNLAPYVDQPNPYVEGNSRWSDTFLPGVIATGRHANGNLYVLPTGITGTAIFYNRDLFAQLGITPPETWGEFMAIQQTIADSGVVPFGFHMSGNPYQANWALRSLQDMLLDDVLGVIKGTGERVLRTGIEGQGVGQKELVAAILRGDYSAEDPRWQEQLVLLKEWSQYWDSSWVSMDVEDAYRMFITGRAAMFWHASARVKPIENDSLRQFEYGTFSFPRLTPADSPFANGVGAPAIGGFTGAGAFTVAATTETNGTRAAAIDFLRFLTAPENLVALNQDLGTTIPGVRAEYSVAPELRPFIDSLDRGVFRIETFFRGLTREYSDQFVRILQEYLFDRLTIEQAAAQIQEQMEVAAQDLIELNGWTDIP